MMASRALEFFLTINNYDLGDVEQMHHLHLTGVIEHAIIGYEGAGKTPHLQICTRFVCYTSWKHVKQMFPRAHIEICRNYGAAIWYCKKEGYYQEIGKF